MIDPDFYDCLVPNDDDDFNGGFGFWLNQNAPTVKLNKIREIHEIELKRGKPYWVLDVLLEDFQKGVEIEIHGGEFYRKTDVPAL